jgi:hypothetical protein
VGSEIFPVRVQGGRVHFFLLLLHPLTIGLITEFLHFTEVGLLGRVISSSQGLYLNTGQHKHRINACTHQTSMAYVGFEPTIPASERVKTVHASDHWSTVTGKTKLGSRSTREKDIHNICLSVCLSACLCVYSCCSHLEPRASVKRLFHFCFLILVSR